MEPALCFYFATSVHTSAPSVVKHAVLLAVLVLGGCGAEEGRALRVVETLPLADSAMTLAVDAEGRHWLGGPGEMRVRDAAGSTRDLRLPPSAVPRVLGWMNGTVYLRMGGALLAARGQADSLIATRDDFGRSPLLCDVRGRALLQGARSGAVLGHDPASLETVWAWAALGARTTALAASPEGDRLYQALDYEDDEPQVRTRDLQTGRELARLEMDFPLLDLVAADDGMLFGVGRDGRRAVVVALRPGGGELEPIWRRSLATTEAAATVRIAVSAGRVAVWGRGPREGLRILDAAEGEILARTTMDPSDFSFGPAGEMWALYPGEIRRLE